MGSVLGSRRRCWWLGACALLVTALFGVVVRGQSSPWQIDSWAWSAARSDRFWNALDVVLLGRASEIVSALWPAATPGAAIVAAAGLGTAYLFAGERRLALFCASAAPLAVALTDKVAKPLFDRTLLGALAYPSGHVTAVVATGTVLTVLAARSGGPRRAMITAALWSVVVAILAIFVLLRRAHYLVDIVGGMGMGTGVVLLVAGWLVAPSAPSSPRPAELQRARQPVDTSTGTRTAAVAVGSSPVRSTTLALRRSHSRQP